jgi:hypothetical protein
MTSTEYNGLIANISTKEYQLLIQISKDTVDKIKDKHTTTLHNLKTFKARMYYVYTRQDTPEIERVSNFITKNYL